MWWSYRNNSLKPTIPVYVPRARQYRLQRGDDWFMFPPWLALYPVDHETCPKYLCNTMLLVEKGKTEMCRLFARRLMHSTQRFFLPFLFLLFFSSSSSSTRARTKLPSFRWRIFWSGSTKGTRGSPRDRGKFETNHSNRVWHLPDDAFRVSWEI